MDISKLSNGTKLVLGGGVLLLIFSFFNWFSVEDLGGVSMWNGLGTLAGLLLVALLVWEGLQLANVNIGLPISKTMVSVLLAVLMLLFVVIRFIDKPGGGLVSDAFDRTIWAWLGLVLAILVVVGAVLNMQAGGESFADMKGSLMAAGSAASSKSRTTADTMGNRPDAPAATPPATTPPAPTSTTSTPMPPPVEEDPGRDAPGDRPAV